MTLNYEIPAEWAGDPREARAYVAGVNMALNALAPRAEQAERERDEARASDKSARAAWEILRAAAREKTAELRARLAATEEAVVEARAKLAEAERSSSNDGLWCANVGEHDSLLREVPTLRARIAALSSWAYLLEPAATALAAAVAEAVVGVWNAWEIAPHEGSCLDLPCPGCEVYAERARAFRNAVSAYGAALAKASGVDPRPLLSRKDGER